MEPYKCEICGGTFRPSNTSCTVDHGPGVCCHEFEAAVAVLPRTRAEEALDILFALAVVAFFLVGIGFLFYKLIEALAVH